MNGSKKVIYFAGGAMSGVFGAGVAYAFEKHNLYPQIEAIYSASAGVMTGAYFLAHETYLGSTIYWEDLPDHFISRKDFLIGVWQRFQNRFIRRVKWNNLRDAVDLDFLIKVACEKKRLDVERIIAQPIPLFVKLFNLDTHEIFYTDVRKPNMLAILEASMSIFPYVHKIPKINDHSRLIDGSIVEAVGIKELLRLHPHSQIIVVLNSSEKRKLRFRLKKIIEGKFMYWMFGDSVLYDLFASVEDRLKEDIRIIKEDPRVVLIAPPYRTPFSQKTTNPKMLKEAWEIGFREGEKYLGA